MKYLFVDNYYVYTKNICEVEIKPQKKQNNNKNLIILLLTTFAIGSYKFWQQRELKKQKEIERIKSKELNTYPCEQYALVAMTNGLYPCFNCIGLDSIFLYKFEIWKYGKTCIGEEKRYTDLYKMNFRFVVQFTGTEKECLIIEKEKIYIKTHTGYSKV
jgi:hypothetical protein